MKDFFITFSGTTAAVAGIIFAFLISKALGFEELQDNIYDDFEKKELEIKKLEKKLGGIQPVTSIVDYIKNDIECEFQDKLEKEYFNLRGKEEYFVENYCLKKEIYYIDLNELREYLKKITLNFLDKEVEKMKNYFYEMERGDLLKINSLKEVQYKEEFKYLNEVYETIYLYFHSLKEKRRLEKSDFQFFKNIERLEQQYIKSINIGYNSRLTIESEIKMVMDFEKDIKILLIDYIYKKEEIKKLLKKIKTLKNERNNIIGFLGISYIMIIFGVIYPLSYIKYSNNMELDYSLKNFIRELLTVSGFMLGMLFVIFTLFSYKIYLGIKLKNNISEIDERVKNLDVIESQNKILQNFNYFQNIDSN